MIKIRAKNTINKFIFWDFDILPIFYFTTSVMERDYYPPKLQLSTTSKMELDYYQQKLNAQVNSRVAKQLRKIEKTEPSFVCFKNIKKTTAQKN